MTSLRIRHFMDTLDGTATGVVHAFEGGIPFEGNGGATGHGGFGANTTGGRVAGEMLGEDAAIIVFLFVLCLCC